MALRSFTRALIENRGTATEADVQAVEVILGLSIKLMSNYTNFFAGTPLDEEVKQFR